jgi:hypothetical protein
MSNTASRTFTTLPCCHRTYLSGPRNIFGPVNFHDLILDLDQLTNWQQWAAWTVLLVGLGQRRSRSRSRDGNSVLYRRCRVGRRIRRWEYHLVGVLQFERNVGSSLPNQHGTLLAVAGLILQGRDLLRQHSYHVFELFGLEESSQSLHKSAKAESTFSSLLANAPLILLSLTFRPAINS